MILLQLAVLDLRVTRITNAIGRLLIQFAQGFHVPTAFAAHALATPTAVMSSDGHIENLFTDLTRFKFVKGNIIWVEALW